jgi:hypothetical protein
MPSIPEYPVTSTSNFWNTVIYWLQKIFTGATSVAGFTIPAYSTINLSNYNAATPPAPGLIVFELAGTTVATLTLTYDGSNNLASVVKS